MGYQPHEVVYGYLLVVPNSLTRSPEPQYNYQDYQFEMKRLMQETYQMVTKQQIESKLKSKHHYDQKITLLTVNVGDKVLVQEKASKCKSAPTLLGPYPVIEVHMDSHNVTFLKRNKQTRLHRKLLRLFHE